MRLCSTTESRDAKWTFMTVPKSFCCSSVRTNNSRNTLLASSCLKRWRPELNEDGEPFAAYVRSGVLWVKQHNPLTTTGAICIQLSYIKNPVPDWVKSSFVIFDIRPLWRSARMSKITNDGLTWHRMLYSCTHMATVGVKGIVRQPRIRSSVVFKVVQNSQR